MLYENLIVDRMIACYSIEDLASFLPYFELKRLFRDPSKRNIFVSKYSRFYGMNSAGLTNQWKEKYFDILYKKKSVDNFMPYKEILLELKNFPRQQGDYVLQFSFVSKLVSFIDESYPLFDINISNVTGFSIPKIDDEELKIAIFTKNMMLLREQYKKYAEDNRIAELMNEMSKTDLDISSVHIHRVIDFLLWNMGRKIKHRNGTENGD